MPRKSGNSIMRIPDPDYFGLSFASQKVHLDRRTDEDEGEKEEEKRWRTKMRARHHLRTAGSAIIPRPFEFSSFVITTNTRQMKRAKGESARGEEEGG